MATEQHTTAELLELIAQVRAGDRAVEIGDGGDQRGPGVTCAVARVVRIAAIPAAGMKAERSAVA